MILTAIDEEFDADYLDNDEVCLGHFHLFIGDLLIIIINDLF